MSDIALWCMVALNTFCLAVTMRELKQLRDLVRIHQDVLKLTNKQLDSQNKINRYLLGIDNPTN
jgi:hypothetical protein